MKTVFGMISILVLALLFANPVSSGHFTDDTDTHDSTASAQYISPANQYMPKPINKESGPAIMLLFTTGVIGLLMVRR